MTVEAKKTKIMMPFPKKRLNSVSYGNSQIRLKIWAFVTLFVNPFLNGHNSGSECNFFKKLKAQHQVLGMP